MNDFHFPGTLCNHGGIDGDWFFLVVGSANKFTAEMMVVSVYADGGMSIRSWHLSSMHDIMRVVKT
jgi:hypothetical protein